MRFLTRNILLENNEHLRKYVGDINNNPLMDLLSTVMTLIIFIGICFLIYKLFKKINKNN